MAPGTNGVTGSDKSSHPWYWFFPSVARWFLGDEVSMQEMYRNILGPEPIEGKGRKQDWAEGEVKWPCSKDILEFWTGDDSPELSAHEVRLPADGCLLTALTAAQGLRTSVMKQIWPVHLSIHRTSHIAQSHRKLLTWLVALSLSIKFREIMEKVAGFLRPGPQPLVVAEQEEAGMGLIKFHQISEQRPRSG